jgi:putative multiple sugar transport system substrate-binding protein
MKKMLAVLLVLLVAGSVFGGGNKDSGNQAGSTMIGIAMPETHTLRWISDGNNLRKAAESKGYYAQVLWADANQATQNFHIQNFLTQGAKALIIGCLNTGVNPMVTEARRDGVVVVAYDRLIQECGDYDYFITFNNFNVGEAQAQSIVKGAELDGATTANPKVITLFAGAVTDDNAAFFFDGAMSVLNPYIDKGVLKVVGPYPRTSADRANFQRITTENWQAPIAKTRMENLLNNDARDVVLDAVLAPNDPLARAIIEACKADAKYRTKLPVVSGQDAEFESALAIKNGDQYSTVFKDTSKLAEAAVVLVDQILKGQPINVPGAVLAEGDLAKIGDVYKAEPGRRMVKTYILPVTLVTKDNFNVLIEGGAALGYSTADINRLR